MPKTFAQKVIQFSQDLHFTGTMPPGFRVINPFLENLETMDVVTQFYQKYYNDTAPRKLILGINPGRHGAAVTGIPFTDTKRLESVCGIAMKSAKSHEISSVFIYDMIAAFGGAPAFYRQFYITSLFPLVLVQQGTAGRWVNANYYDTPALFETLKPQLLHYLKAHVSLGVDTSEVFILGRKNALFIQKLNAECPLFQKVIPLDHPRYIQQYKLKGREGFIAGYLETFKGGV